MTTRTPFSVSAQARDPGFAESAIRILTRVLGDRAGIPVQRVLPGAAADLLLIQRPGMGGEGYAVERGAGAGGRVTVAAAGSLGLLAGVGKWLRSSHFDGTAFHPGTWSGASSPRATVRGMYLPCRGNWYGYATTDEFQCYVEDLALWGINTICCYLPETADPDSPDGARIVERNRALLRAVREVGLRTALIREPNMVHTGVPAEVLAPPFRDTDPPRRGTGGPRVCPSHPDGWKLILRSMEQYLDGYEDIGLDYVVAFPYDGGGCGCPGCWPWGARGYLRLCKELSRLARARHPGCKFVVGTWCFDVCETPDGEFEGLDRELRRDRSWADYIMADAHEDFPRYPLEHGSPGGLPLITFPEISMWGRFPWGGFGANPFPARLQRLWNQVSRLCDGGFPYSEGIYEDLNKFVVSQFYWDAERPAADSVREYAAYEFSPAVADAVSLAVQRFEATLPRATWRGEDIEQAWALCQQADRQLPPGAREAWRWRVLYLRGLIDHELFTHPGQPHSEPCDQAFEELTRIYHAETGWGPVSPRSRRCLERLRQQAAPPPPPGAENR
ncbi:MAG: hypothetical protein BWZ02_01818 [Lentisphaerae bacterium ADurb.BinA184]|nr:MAG: hypothetical protein BWZ02_01818 [Lentisphaerae bacterium ADurb.BinA184]